MVLDDPLIMVDPGVHFVDQPVRPRAQALDTNPRNPAHMLGPSPRFDVRPRATPHACWARVRVSTSAPRNPARMLGPRPRFGVRVALALIDPTACSTHTGQGQAPVARAGAAQDAQQRSCDARSAALCCEQPAREQQRPLGSPHELAERVHPQAARLVHEVQEEGVSGGSQGHAANQYVRGSREQGEKEKRQGGSEKRQGRAGARRGGAGGRARQATRTSRGQTDHVRHSLTPPPCVPPSLPSLPPSLPSLPPSVPPLVPPSASARPCPQRL